MASGFQLRDFRKADFARLWEIDQQCFTEGIAYSEAELAYYITRKTAFTIVAEGSGERGIVGFLTAQRYREKGRTLGHVITIDVMPEARRSGLGSELMREAEKRLLASECRTVTLEVAVDNATAIAFYQRHGYSIVRTIPRYYNGELDALRMEKDL